MAGAVELMQALREAFVDDWTEADTEALERYRAAGMQTP